MQDCFTLPASDHNAVRLLAARCALPFPLASVLWCRGLQTAESALQFLAPGPEGLHDPRHMLGLPFALERIRKALLAHEPILIYGDYDVDGTVATVLLKTALERSAAALGASADVRFHIPHRLREGYGMREARIADAAEEGVRLIISVDTGIRAFAAAREAERLGLDLIVTDHHLPESIDGIPKALAVLNPNQPGCAYPYKELCGAAVAFKLAQALVESCLSTAEERQRWKEKTLPSFLKLLAIATVADAVPLTGENRVIAALGLEALRQPAQPGLRRLMELAGIDLNRPLTTTDVGFRLGPRINAAGRMDVASDVVSLFLTREVETAHALAEKLHRLNDDRRATEMHALAEIETQLEALTAEAAELPGCVVLDDSACGPWHKGVIGILASRVVDRTGRPALVVTHENGQAHGSGRSVTGFHLLDALTAAHAAGDQPLFSRFGGHAHAAGFVLPSDRVALLRSRMLEQATACAHRPVSAATACDALLTLADLDDAFLSSYARLAPFGQGHAEPVFLAQRLRLCSAPRVFGERHLELRLADQSSAKTWRAVAWSRRTLWAQLATEQRWAAGDHFDVAFRLTLNWHPQYGGWELAVEDIQPCASS